MRFVKKKNNMANDIFDSFMAKRKAKNDKIGFRSSLYKAMIELNMST